MKKQRTLAEVIRSLREGKDWTAAELARQAGITRQYVGEIEAGEKMPSLEIAVRLARALEVELNEFEECFK